MKAHIQLAKLAESRKQEIESTRNIPVDIIDQVKDLGLVKLWATRKCGGSESSVWEVAEMVQSMAYHNGSLAWVVAVTRCSALFSGYLGSDEAQAIFGGARSMIGGFAGPSGIALKEGESLVVHGHWSWGSGITHCSHVVGGVMVMEGDKRLGTAICFFEQEEITMIDNWHVLGLKGSHSIDYKAENVKIPASRWSWFPLDEAQSTSPIYRFSFLGALSVSVASVGLGLAQRSLVEIKNLAKSKSPFGVGKPLSKKPEVQAQFAEIEGKYRAAYALLKNTIEAAHQETLQQKCSLDSKAHIRLATAHATKLSHEVVQDAYRLGGGTSLWEKHKLEELLRDINTVTQHGMVSYGNFRTVGAVLLGNDVPEVLL